MIPSCHVTNTPLPPLRPCARQVILNSPKLIEEEKAKMASKEKALKEKEGQKPASKTNNTVNGTGGTPIHVNTLQVNTVSSPTALKIH